MKREFPEPAAAGPAPLPWVGRTALGLVGTYSRFAPTERGGYRLARLARSMLPRPAWTGRFRTPHGLRLGLDLGIYPDCCMAVGLYELDTIRAMRRLLRPGDHFVDIGANLGYMTLLGAQMVGEGGRVDAFEADPGNFARLSDHVRSHPTLSARIDLHPIAVSDRAATVAIHHFSGGDVNHGCSSVFRIPGRDAPTSRVPADRLDAMLQGRRPRLIKIDVEGAEHLVVSGMTGLLTGPEPPAVIAEHNPATAARAGVASDLFVRMLREAQPRYGVWAIGPWMSRLRPSAGAFGRLGQVNLLLRV
jgi:FkbM family methyltransferase